MHAVDWLTGGEENASLLLLELLALVIDIIILYNSHKFTQKVYIVNVISYTFSSGIRFLCKCTCMVCGEKNKCIS